MQEISGILATNFHTLNIPGTTNYGLVTNFWGKFPLAAPPPPQTARGKLAKSLLLDSHSSSSGGRQEKGIRDKLEEEGVRIGHNLAGDPLTNAQLP